MNIVWNYLFPAIMLESTFRSFNYFNQVFSYHNSNFSLYAWLLIIGYFSGYEVVFVFINSWTHKFLRSYFTAIIHLLTSDFVSIVNNLHFFLFTILFVILIYSCDMDAPPERLSLALFLFFYSHHTMPSTLVTNIELFISIELLIQGWIHSNN